METIFDSEAASRTFKISLQPSGTGNGKISSRSETGQPPYDVQGDRSGNHWPQTTYRRPERAILLKGEFT
jgi:hypothetical protein